MTTTTAPQPHENFGDKAPIVEALIDVQVAPSEEVELATLKEFAEPFASEFPIVEEQKEWQGKITLSQDVAPSITTRWHDVRGFVFRSPSHHHVVQVRRDGITISRLQPYDSWSSFSAIAKKAWDRYVALVSPTTVTRVGVRYINRISIPGTKVQLQDWFCTRPEVPDSFVMAHFLMRAIVMHPTDRSSLAAVALATEPVDPGTPAMLGFMLDIDAWTNEHHAPSSTWDRLPALHDFKNELFFGSLTDRTKQRIRES